MTDARTKLYSILVKIIKFTPKEMVAMENVEKKR